MGLAASQARMLMLVNRKADLLYRGQTVQSRRLALAYKTESVAADYTKAISNKLYRMKSTQADGSVSWKKLSASDMLGAASASATSTGSYIFLDKTGNPLTGLYDIANGAATLKTTARTVTDDSLQTLISTGEVQIVTASSYFLNKTDATKNPLTVIDPRSDTTDTFEQQYDTTDDERATAEYEQATAEINTQDKKYELELKNIETQEKAVETEMDAVKKVIEKNVESTFKTFG